MANFLFYCIPGATLNSSLEYLTRKIGLFFRENLTNYYHSNYLKNMVFYQISNLDSRIPDPDNIIVSEIEKWSNTLASLYSNTTKPTLDLILFTYKLSSNIGYTGPILVIIWYLLTGYVIRKLTPQFAEMIYTQQKLEGEYRSVQSSIVAYSEEIAFFRGNKYEKKRIEKIFQNLIEHNKEIYEQRFNIQLIEDLLGKYSSAILGYLVLACPVLASDSTGIDTGVVVKDYIKDVSLLINLTKAVGRILKSYQDVQGLIGITHSLKNFEITLEDMTKQHFVKNIDSKTFNRENSHIIEKSKSKELLKNFIGGAYEIEDFIEFVDVPIVTPNNEILIEDLNFLIRPGQHTIITGSNGIGKTSIFRVLRNLWPLRSGIIRKPNYKDIFYVPQRPYLPFGTLRDQIIYPSTFEDFKEHHCDDQLVKILELVNLKYVLLRTRKGFDSIKDWNDVLSGGEKQRMAFARLFFHRPKFAILDEATSAVSFEMEGKLYQIAKDFKITLLTISHRKSLWTYHDYVLKIDISGKYNFEKINKD